MDREGMRIPNAEHEGRSWRIREVVPDFRLEDAWALPAQGGVNDFATLIGVMASLDGANGESRATRLLFRARHCLGGWLGWDDQPGQLPIPGSSEATLSTRLP